MQRKQGKTRLKIHNGANMEILHKLLYLPFLIILINNGDCIKYSEDSSNLVNSNFSSIYSEEIPAFSQNGHGKWRHYGHRRRTFDRHLQNGTDFAFESVYGSLGHFDRSINIASEQNSNLKASFDVAKVEIKKIDSSASASRMKINDSDSSSVASVERSDDTILSEIKYLRRNLNKGVVNFMMTDTLIDGEKENRIHIDGISAKETYIGSDGNGLKFRQLTDGRHLVQMIYRTTGDIYDCEYITQAKSVRNFLKTLRKELKRALQEENEKLFTKNHQRRQIPEENEEFYRNFKNVSFRIFKHGDALPRELDWLNYEQLKLQCLEKHEEIKYFIESKNTGNKASKVANEITRKRRSFQENFIVPGTKWCGIGQLATTYNELGADKKEDKCCRAHDLCPLHILPFTRRFGTLNARMYTVSHCRCDRRFRACLKLADTSVSNMVGKLFFNVVQTKCFILKPSKVCVKRSWWGKCLKKGFTKQAHLRDNLSY